MRMEASQGCVQTLGPYPRPKVASTASSQSLVSPHPPREPQGLFGRVGWEDKNWPLDLGNLPSLSCQRPAWEREAEWSGVGTSRLILEEVQELGRGCPGAPWGTGS